MTYRGIEFNGTSGNCTGGKYWCNYNRASWWKVDRLLVLMQATSQGVNETFCLKSALGVTQYSEDANRYCIIDITDIARTYPPTTAANYIFVLHGQGTESDQDWTVVMNTAAQGLINPDSVIIPEHALQEDAVKIMPPDMIISPVIPPSAIVHQNFDALQIEFRAAAAWDIMQYESYDTSVTSVINQPTEELMSEEVTQFTIVKDAHHEGSPGHLIYIKPQSCERNYVQVEWRSFTGVIRRHIFEARQNKVSTNDDYELLNLANEYTEIKDREDSIVLHLENLTAYDLWYYADLVNSSEVYIKIKSTAIKKRVQITDKSFTVPDGTNFDGVLDITINWRKNDAVIM